MLKRKIDNVLLDWYKREDHNPLIVYGSRQIGKSTSILNFAKQFYKSVIEINFIRDKEYKKIFDDGFNPDDINYNISLINPSHQFIPNDTLIFFDEIQDQIDVVSALKFYSLDGRFDVICSGSMLGINYKKITSISVGFKEDYHMYSMDFEEFLWACGYDENLVDNMCNLEPLSDLEFNKLSKIFKQFITVGGLPNIVNHFVQDKTLYNVIQLQNQLYIDYENDIKNYVNGLDVSRVVNFYRHITPMLSRDNHKFQISKIGHGAKNREFVGCDEWLKDAGIINIAYNINDLTLPLKGNEIESDKRIYYSDNALLIASLDEYAKEDLRINNNFEIYNGALTESFVSEGLIKSGYKELYFYKNKNHTIEIDFVVRCKNELVPIEVKTRKGRTKSLNNVLQDNKFKFGIKLTNQNIGYSNKKYTFPYFLTFLLNRFLEKKINW